MLSLANDLVPSQVRKDLELIYGERAYHLVDFWNETQIRPPASFEEVEDVFFWEILE